MKAIYVLLTVVFFLIISFIIHAIIELLYLWWAQSVSTEIVWTGVFGKSCALPLWLIYLLPIVAIFVGIGLGFFWWKKIYRD